MPGSTTTGRARPGGAVETLDSLALEIRVFSAPCERSQIAAATRRYPQRSYVIQDEFSMIQAHHARITRPPTGSELACDDGLGQADAMTRLTPQALGVCGRVASVVTAEDVEWALVQ